MSFWIRNTTKLAGKKDITAVTQMDTSMFTDVLFLQRESSLLSMECVEERGRINISLTVPSDGSYRP